MHLHLPATSSGRALHARPVARSVRLVPVRAYRAEDVSGNQQPSRRPPGGDKPSKSEEVPNLATQKPVAPESGSTSAPSGLTSPGADVSNLSTQRPVKPDSTGPSGSTGSSGPAVASPAVQMANYIAEQQAADDKPPTVQLADNIAAGQRQQTTNPAQPRPADPSARGSNRGPDRGSDSSSRDRAPRDVQTPADFINQGIRAAADTAESVISQAAGTAIGGIAGATNITTQGVSAAERAAEDTARNLADAAERTLNVAATAVGGTAGAIDGAVTGLTSDTDRSRRDYSSDGSYSSYRRNDRNSRGNGGQSAGDTGSFDSANVRVPGNMAWANATPPRGTMRDVTKTQDFDEDEVEDLKVQILAAVASLDRGLAANLREAQEVDKLCHKLEDAAGPITLKWSTSRSSPDSSTMDRLAGTWRLIYSSGFNGGSLGGSRPGPPAALVPTILGQVYQVINYDQMLLDNVVELLLNYGAPQLPFLPKMDPQPTPGIRVTLRHTYDVSQPNTVTIVFESTSAKAIGPDILQNLPQIGVPELPDFLKPPKNFRSASFDVTYLDASMRITRGDRGELRIYLRDKPLNASAPADYLD